jgi:hypothetical protein
MLGSLLGSINKERALLFLAAREKGYAREIARFYGVPLYPIQGALDKLEAAGALVSFNVGKTRQYQFNPRYPARKSLSELVGRYLELAPEPLRKDLLVYRSRPRRRGKPV